MKSYEQEIYEKVFGKKDNHKANLNNFKNKKILIAGAGSIGRELINLLSDTKTHLKIVDISEENLSKTRDILDSKKFKNYSLILSDIRGSKFLYDNEKINYDVIINTAAYKHVVFCEENKFVALDNNVGVAISLLKLNPKDCHLLVSTDKAVYPTTYMGKTKRLCELLYFQNEKGKVVRFGNVFGSSGSLLPRIEEGIRRGNVFITNKNVRRYFMSINQACNLILDTIYNEKTLNILDMGQQHKVRDIIKKIVSLNKKKVKYINIGLYKNEKEKEKLHYDKKVKKDFFSILNNFSPTYLFENLDKLEVDPE